MRRADLLAKLYPPSPPCSCPVCRSYCVRPGWWTVEQAAAAFASGLGSRMMLEFPPDRSYGILAPAFRGCEGFFAVREFSGNGCCFLRGGACELHGTGFFPLECAFCHHARPGRGPRCHLDLGLQWRSGAARALVSAWIARHLGASCQRAGRDLD